MWRVGARSASATSCATRCGCARTAAGRAGTDRVAPAFPGGAGRARRDAADGVLQHLRRRVVRRLAALGALGLLGVLLWSAPAAADPGLSVSDVRATAGQLTFTVTGPAGTSFGGLTVDLGGTPLTVTVQPAATPSTTPASVGAEGSVVLVVDTSGSMAGARLAGAKAAADGY